MKKLTLLMGYLLGCIQIILAQSFNNLPVITQKPPLHGRHWMAVTGKPLAATAGAMIFNKGGNAIDASCAMLAATCTMWDVLSWGGETQALIYNPKTKKVIAINALGVAPTGATADFFKNKGMKYPPEYGPLAAVTPGTPGGLMTILAEYGTMSLKDVLAPAMQMAEGYPIEAQTANQIERNKEMIKQWPYSKKVFLPHLGEKREAPDAGEVFVQKDLLETLKKLVETEQQALKKGKSRKDAIYAAYDRFYKGDIAKEIARGCKEQGGLITEQDLANWKVKIEEPTMTSYRGIDVYKLQPWTQGPAMLQTLNILENFDIKSMGYNSTRYIHTLYQAMNLAFADRDFYYGDPAFAPEEPIKGLLSKEYAKERSKLINFEMNDPKIGPGDPYPFEGKQNPYKDVLQKWGNLQSQLYTPGNPVLDEKYFERFQAGTTSVEAADKEGWVVSITPSGGWVPACIAGNTGVGLSQRMQSFVLDPKENPFNVVEPGKRPRVTLTPTLALKDGKPFLSFAKQAGDEQDQLLLQFFLNIVEFNMTVQEACEAPSFKTLQMYSSFGAHEKVPGGLVLNSAMPTWVRKDLTRMGYSLSYQERTSGPINAIWFDWQHGTFWGGSSNHGEDYGIGW
ncbi:gamma-glutamyltransferase family protein [Xanthocytophaga agilis]|uniref:Gamma-glutamyltransferase family protein n=1 Tax=Xanthocytophaga agilis TaxID=3048010 RepID=A0AAE3UJR5_9BACT|nr:gamma-glutamyltransferase family protein [Xanthocytophaga agilis]MDJ1506387.1 gamma-glutamyltransferase family protein [Xanthocytophaga agilis]